MTGEVTDVFRAAFQLEDGFLLERTMSYEDVPGWDSVGHMNLVTELESRLGISLDIDEIVGLDCVGAVEELVARKRNG